MTNQFNMRHLALFSIMAGLLFSFGCEPNQDVYDDLDERQRPYSKAIEYTITSSDYNGVGGEVADYQAFTEAEPAANHVPDILSGNFIALNVGSSAMVTFNQLIEDPVWYNAGFGYELTEEDYEQLGISDAFTPNNLPENNLPFFLLRKYPGASEGDTEKLIYNFRDGDTQLNIDTYEFDGSDWVLEERREDIPFVGYEFTEEDYDHFGGSIGRFNNFSDDDPADVHIPVWLKNNYPYAIEGTEKVVKYMVFSGGSTSPEIAHYTFDGLEWHRTSYIEVISEQYVYGEIGWAFDPTTRFVMSQSDYMHLAVIDPIPHAQYDDFGYYYGASAFYENFDMRLMARRIEKDDDGNYRDAELGAIYDSEGSEAAVDEMFRRIVEEGLIKVLQNRYPDATPQSGGIDVYYIVGFETFNDNFSRSYLEAEYRCTASGEPPQFELIEGPRERE